MPNERAMEMYALSGRNGSCLKRRWYGSFSDAKKKCLAQELPFALHSAQSKRDVKRRVRKSATFDGFIASIRQILMQQVTVIGCSAQLHMYTVLQSSRIPFFSHISQSQVIFLPLWANQSKIMYGNMLSFTRRNNNNNDNRIAVEITRARARARVRKKYSKIFNCIFQNSRDTNNRTRGEFFFRRLRIPSAFHCCHSFVHSHSVVRSFVHRFFC